MRVEPAQLGVVKGGCQARLDELGDKTQTFGKPEFWIAFGRSRARAEDLFKPGTAGVGDQRAALDELQVRARLSAWPAADRIQGGAMLLDIRAIGQAEASADLLQACERRDMELTPGKRLRKFG